MARYIGPKARVSRRLGTNLWGTRGETIALDRRPYPPGEHGRSRRRTNASEYLIQLQEKQKARFSYGLSERQFRNLYEEANRRPGVTGENMLRFLELRLDNVVYRAGWAAPGPRPASSSGTGTVTAAGSTSPPTGCAKVTSWGCDPRPVSGSAAATTSTCSTARLRPG